MFNFDCKLQFLITGLIFMGLKVLLVKGLFKCIILKCIIHSFMGYFVMEECDQDYKDLLRVKVVTAWASVTQYWVLHGTLAAIL